MKIHSANPDKPPRSGQSDYFFNYFTLGLVCMYSVCIQYSNMLYSGKVWWGETLVNMVNRL